MNWYNELLNISSESDEALFGLVEFIAELKESSPHVIFPWSGGKTKMKEKLQQIFEELNEEKIEATGETYDTYIDAFYGGGGSFFALYEDLLFAGITKVIVNDINECLLTVHKNIAYNYEELKSEYTKIIEEKFIKRYGSLHIDNAKQIAVYEKIREEFYELQEKKDFGVKSSIRFIILTMFAYSGNTKINNDGTFQFIKNSVYNEKGLLSTLSIPIRLKKFNEIYNKFDIEFREGDAFKIIDEYKNNPNALINIDPPYVAENRSKIFTKKTPILGVGIEYGQSDFPHKRLVKKSLNNINFIYNNNIHPFLLWYEKKYQLHGAIHDRPNSNSRVEKGTKRDIVREIILYGNKAL
ncbi:MAG: hypothetical protein U9R37_06630 [Campylobacterota bacterium]|nr:hypothetical protein [Campylobacterota bacterium]